MFTKVYALAVFAVLFLANSLVALPTTNFQASNTQTTLPRGTVVSLELCQPLSSATAVEGAQVQFRVQKDVKVDGKVVIAAGALAEGLVVNVCPAGALGRPGRLSIEAVQVASVIGQPISLESYRIEFCGKNRFLRRGGEARTGNTFVLRAWSMRDVDF